MGLEVNIEKRLGNFHLRAFFETGDEPIALLGASGSGKSVTLRCIAGILRPDTGRIVLNGRVLFDSAAGVNLPPQRRRIGYLFQQYALFPNMTVRQNIASVAKKNGQPQLTEALLHRFHLQDVANHRPRQLSGGQQQRTALARILASEPEAILLDEPLSALDSHLRRQIEIDLQRTLSEFAAPAVWVTHDQGEACRSCRQVCLMDQGQAQGVRSMEDFFACPDTIAAARLSGCETIVEAEEKDGKLLVPAWNLVLTCRPPARRECSALGLRTRHLRSSAPGEENAFACRVEAVISDAFHDLLMLRPAAAQAQAPTLSMEAEKGAYAPGDSLWIAVAPEHVLSLQKGGI